MVSPYCSQQPEDSQAYCAVDAKDEEEAVAKSETSDGEKFIEEVDHCGEAWG